MYFEHSDEFIAQHAANVKCKAHDIDDCIEEFESVLYARNKHAIGIDLGAVRVYTNDGVTLFAWLDYENFVGYM